MRSHAHNVQQGFTLVEVLVALSVVALVLSLTASSIGTGTRVAAVVVTAVEQNEELFIVQRMLRRQLGSARPAVWTRGSPGDVVGFRPSADRIDFLAPPPAPDVRQGAWWYTLRLHLPDPASRDAGTLVLHYGPANPDPPADEAGASRGERVILTGFSDGRFAYRSPDGHGSAVWTSQWHQLGELPRLVRLSLAFPDNDRLVWTDLVVAPRIRALPEHDDG